MEKKNSKTAIRERNNVDHEDDAKRRAGRPGGAGGLRRRGPGGRSWHHRYGNHHRPVRADVRAVGGFRARPAAGGEDVVRGSQQERRHSRPQDQGSGRGRQMQSDRSRRGRKKIHHGRQDVLRARRFVLRGGRGGAGVRHARKSADGDAERGGRRRGHSGDALCVRRLCRHPAHRRRHDHGIRDQGAEGQAHRLHRA